jgi:molecular chaperone DnaJ
MPKDYYIVLGVSRGADPGRIKKAYRECAKQYHPDTASSAEDSRRFHEIQEAYEILSDARRRRAYDREVQQAEASSARRSAPDLIRPRARERMRDIWSRVDDFFEGFVPGMYPDYFEKGHGKGKDLYLEVLLEPEEALRGGLFPVTVPLVTDCPRCGSGGYLSDFLCPACRGSGVRRTRAGFSLSIPPRVRHGTAVRLPMDDIGLRGTHVNVLILVAPAAAEAAW